MVLLLHGEDFDFQIKIKKSTNILTSYTRFTPGPVHRITHTWKGEPCWGSEARDYTMVHLHITPQYVVQFLPGKVNPAGGLKLSGYSPTQYTPVGV